MATTAHERAQHIKDSIADIRAAVDGRPYEQAFTDRTAWLALERCLEIISEASRKLPEDWKSSYGTGLPWHDIANIGNTLRHAYHHVVAPRLWNVYTDDLDPLEAAIDAMLAANPKPPWPS